MDKTKIYEKTCYLYRKDKTQTEKIKFIEKLYKLANISFSEYIKNGQNYGKK